MKQIISLIIFIQILSENKSQDYGFIHTNNQLIPMVYKNVLEISPSNKIYDYDYEYNFQFKKRNYKTDSQESFYDEIYFPINDIYILENKQFFKKEILNFPFFEQVKKDHYKKMYNDYKHQNKKKINAKFFHHQLLILIKKILFTGICNYCLFMTFLLSYLIRGVEAQQDNFNLINNINLTLMLKDALKNTISLTPITYGNNTMNFTITDKNNTMNLDNNVPQYSNGSYNNALYKICQSNQLLAQKYNINGNKNNQTIGLIGKFFDGIVNGQCNINLTEYSSYEYDFYKFSGVAGNSDHKDTFNFKCNNEPVFSNFMDQQYDMLIKFQSIEDCMNNLLPGGKNNLNALNFPPLITNKDDYKYNFIYKNNDGNFLGIKGPITINGTNFYMGRTVNINGNIVGNTIEYFKDIPGLNNNLNIQKQQKYQQVLYNNNTVNFQCNPLFKDNNYSIINGTDYFNLCSFENQQIKFLIYGNDPYNNIQGLIAYISNNINNINYQYKSFNTNEFDHNNVIVEQFVPIDLEVINSGSDEFCNTAKDRGFNVCINLMNGYNNYNNYDNYMDAVYFNKVRKLFNGYIYNVKNLKFPSITINSNSFNQEFQWLFWILNFSWDGNKAGLNYNFYKKKCPNDSLGVSPVDIQQYFILCSNLFKNNPSSSYQIPYPATGGTAFGLINCHRNAPFRQYNNNATQSLGGNFYTDGENINSLKTYETRMNNGSLGLWFAMDNDKDFFPENKDFIFRIPNSVIWDGKVLGKETLQYNLTFATDTNFNQLFYFNNNTGTSESYSGRDPNYPKNKKTYMDQNPPIIQSPFGYDFFNNFIKTIDYVSNVRFTSVNLKNLTNNVFYQTILNLYPNDNIQWQKLAWENNMLKGCNTQCFQLDYNGFPVALSNNIVDNNPYNKTSNNYTFMDLSIKKQWIYYDENHKSYNCNLIFFNGTQLENLAIGCYEYSYSKLLFMYLIQDNIMMYPLGINNFIQYYIFNTIDNNVIYYNPQNKKGFSNSYHQVIPSKFFNIFNNNDTEIYDENKILINYDNLWIKYNYNHHLNIKTNLKIKKKFFNYDGGYLKTIYNKLEDNTQICNNDNNNITWCYGGNIEAFMMYYNQNKKLQAIKLSSLDTTNISYPQFIKKQFPDNYLIFEILLPYSPLKFTSDYLNLQCNKIVDTWFDNSVVQLPMGNFCQWGNTKFLELLLEPQWNIYSQQKINNIRQFFLCSDNLNNTCSFYLLNNTIVNCNNDDCIMNGQRINQNFMDQLMDKKLLASINRQFKLNITKIIGLYPQNDYFIGNFMNFNIVGNILLNYNIPALDTYYSWLKYRLYASIGSEGLILILYCIYGISHFKLNNSKNKKEKELIKKIITGVFISSLLTFLPYIFNLFSDILLIKDKQWNGLDHDSYLFDDKFVIKFYTIFAINIVLGIVNGYILYYLQKSRKKVILNKNRSVYNRYGLNMLSINLFNIIQNIIQNNLFTNNKIQIIFNKFNDINE